MARNSGKISRLSRRKGELEHAIKHEFKYEVIMMKAEKVRAAALIVLKKSRPPFFEYDDTEEIRIWKALEDRWRSLSLEEIVEIVPRWPDSFSMRDIRLSASDGTTIHR